MRTRIGECASQEVRCTCDCARCVRQPPDSRTLPSRVLYDPPELNKLGLDIYVPGLGAGKVCGLLDGVRPGVCMRRSTYLNLHWCTEVTRSGGQGTIRASHQHRTQVPPRPPGLRRAV
jgi:hypothetical protein